jgi:predicted metal-dependent hydrolase
MAHKKFSLNEHIDVTIFKRKSSKSVRLSVAATGEVRVSIPLWAPYHAGFQFAKSREAWIQSQRQPKLLLVSGMAVGKAHHLRLLPNPQAKRVTSRVIQSEIIVKYPVALQPSDSAVQQVAEAASIRALRREAEKLLPQRLAVLAEQHGFEYSSVTIKQLKSRWGSCDQQQAIVLNLFLMQLPWECIDYVLLHELTHTRLMQHGPNFWHEMRKIIADLARIRKVMRSYQPVLHSVAPQLVP